MCYFSLFITHSPLEVNQGHGLNVIGMGEEEILWDLLIEGLQETKLSRQK